MPNISDYRDILVILDTRQDKITKASLEVLTKAREIGDALGARVEALVLGHSLEGLSEQAIHMGADIVLVAEHESLTTGNVDAYFAAALPVIKDRKPEIVLMSSTPLGLDLAPRLGAALGTGALSDATKLEVDESDRLLIAKRLYYDGSVEAAATIPRHRPQIASLRPGAVRVGFPDDSRYGSVERVEVNIPRGALKVELVGIEDDEIPEQPLDEAEVVVAGGNGSDFDNVRELARALNGAWGASRAAVQFGQAPAERQVGATGAHLKPKLYIATGVSGQFEHYYGVKDSETIVAINPDKNAPIFRYAQYAIVGDAKEVIPKFWNISSGIEDASASYKKHHATPAALVPTFDLAQEAEFRDFVAEHARVIVLFRGVGCPYSATFERVFVETPAPEGWERAIRRVEEGGHGPVAEALGVDVTPTLGAFEGGTAAKRLAGRIMLGVSRASYRRWLTTL